MSVTRVDIRFKIFLIFWLSYESTEILAGVMLWMEYVQHADGVVIICRTNYQVFSPPFLTTFARGCLCIVRDSSY